MLIPYGKLIAAVATVSLFAIPCGAQQSDGLMGDLMKDVSELQSKLTGLAKQMPADRYDWRPGVGVRSLGEVLLHVAADNYLMPSAVGVAPDATTGISATDFSTLSTFEKQKLSSEATISTMEKSFAHLMQAMAGTPEATLNDRVKFFGSEMSVRQVWVLTTTHLHEHLGQAIAYARMNGVAPAWSR